MKFFLISTSVFDFALGLFGPFWFLFLSDFGGGIEQFGFAVAFMTIASAITSLFAGKISDIIGRKKSLIITGVSLAIVIFLYTLINSVISLYILQIFYGILLSIQGLNESALIGDLTQKDTRGFNVGLLHFFSQLSAGIAMLLVGFFGSHIDLNYIFYITAVFLFISSIFVAKIKEV